MYHRKVKLSSPERQAQAQKIIKLMGKMIRNPPKEGIRGYTQHYIGLCVVLSHARRAANSLLGTEAGDEVHSALRQTLQDHKPKTDYANTRAYWWPLTPKGTKKRLAVIKRMAKQFA